MNAPLRSAPQEKAAFEEGYEVMQAELEKERNSTEDELLVEVMERVLARYPENSPQQAGVYWAVRRASHLVFPRRALLRPAVTAGCAAPLSTACSSALQCSPPMSLHAAVREKMF